MKKRFLVAMDSVYYPDECFESIKFKINLGDCFTVDEDENYEYIEIYDKKTDNVYKLDYLIINNKIKYMGQEKSYYIDDPDGKKYGVKGVNTKYMLIGI